jgi:hypothetical protein
LLADLARTANRYLHPPRTIKHRRRPVYGASGQTVADRLAVVIEAVAA